MKCTDLQILDKCTRWLTQGQRVVLATVVQTWGSSPRPVGSWAAISGDGQIAGSVSGGCIEDDLLTLVKNGGPTLPVEKITYGRDGRLPCGSVLELVLESTPDVDHLLELQTHIRKREVVLRRVDLATGLCQLLPPAGARVQLDEHSLQVHFGPQWGLLIIGANEIGRHLAPLAESLDFAVTVCDPRRAYAEDWPHLHIPCLTDMPDDVVDSMAPDMRLAVVAVTHDPKQDDLALLSALKSTVFYVGALGSVANQVKRKARLSEHFGLTQAQLDRLHGPAGLPINSRTPAEIAVAIVAELIAERAMAEKRFSTKRQEKQLM